MISVFGSKYTDDDIDGVIKCLKSNWTGIGDNVKKFESEFQKKISTDNFTMVDSGSNAIYLALRNLNLPLGSEVILPSFTWVSCAQSILMNGLIPVFCDVDILTQNVTSKLISEKITEKTSAILIVHYAGLPVDIKPILELGYPVIEDAAHAVDSTVDGVHCGTFGDVGIWSFDSVKNIAVGEGGGIYFKDKEKSKKSVMMRYCGIGFSGFHASKNNNGLWWEYNITEPNIKMLPSDIEGSLALSQLKNLNSNQIRRKEIWEFYQSSFKSSNLITPVNQKTNETHSYFTYLIQVNEKDRNSLAKNLYEKGIYTTLRYHPLHLNSVYKTNVKLTNSEILNKTGLNIPLHQNLSDNEVNYIVDSIKKIVN